MKSKRLSDGFTMIELIVVIAIIAILTTYAAGKFLGRTDDAKKTKLKHDIQTISNALNLYRVDNHAYPSTDQGLEALITMPSGEPEPTNWQAGGYLERLPKDPWDQPYYYLNPGEHGEIDIYSLGQDKRPGGEGMNADVGNWNLE